VGQLQTDCFGLAQNEQDIFLFNQTFSTDSNLKWSKGCLPKLEIF
jgi:hypothetical protein